MHPILKAVDYDLNHTVFSFIPNTAEVAYFGMQEGLNNYLNKLKKEWIADRSHLLREEELEQILSMRVRSEKVAIKDIKLRTFIAEGNSRNDLAAHVYDITYGSIEPFIDNLVVIDDSIVRGTTLRQSIIGILDRLHPKKIVIVSSSPQVRYPDYYGIDMSRMNEFIALRLRWPCYVTGDGIRDLGRLSEGEATTNSGGWSVGELRKGDIRPVYGRGDIR